MPKLQNVPFVQRVLQCCAEALPHANHTLCPVSFRWNVYRHALAAIVCAAGLHLDPPSASDFRFDGTNNKLLKGNLSGLPAWLNGAGLHAVLADCTQDLEFLSQATVRMRAAIPGRQSRPRIPRRSRKRQSDLVRQFLFIALMCRN